jgi:hypothetical protein
LRSPGLVAAVLAATAAYLLSGVSLGVPPGAAATGEQLVGWFRDHRDGARWSVWFLTVAAPFLAIVVAQLRRLLPAPHRDVFFLGAAGILVATAVQSWTWGGLALHADRLEPATARTVLDVAILWGPVLNGATTTMMLPVTWLALRGEAGLPRWLGVVGAIACAEQTIETITIFGRAGFTEPGGAMNLQLGAGLVWTWLLAFALWAGLRGEKATE